MNEQPVELNTYSSRITQPKSQGASQAMLLGHRSESRPISTSPRSASPRAGTRAIRATCTSATWASRSRRGVVESGLVGMRFDTIGVSDGISMGTDGMSYSLQSRDLIADSIETVMAAQWYDGLVALPGCDKNMPGVRHGDGPARPPVDHGLRRHDPSRLRRRSAASKRSSTSSLPSRATASSSPARSPRRSARPSCRVPIPGAGACGGMYTANTMATAIEAMGLSLPFSSCTPAEDPAKIEECVQAGGHDGDVAGRRV